MTLARTFLWTPAPDDDFSTIPLPFDPKTVFGKTRAPVVVAIGTHSFRSTVTTMGGVPWVPFRKSNRVAAGVTDEAGPIEVTLTLDETERTVAVPTDLAHALAAMPGAREAWDAQSFTARREQAEAIEEAKRPETRAKRIQSALDSIRKKLE